MQSLTGSEEEGISQPTCKPGAAGLSEALTDESLKAQTPARSRGMARQPLLPAGFWVSESS